MDFIYINGGYYTKDLSALDSIKNAKATKFKVEDGTKIIKRGCFQNCLCLQEVELPNSIEVIEDRAFFNCKSLKEIRIPYGVIIIPRSCFKYCESLEKIILPETIRGIDIDAFNGCINLKKLILFNQVRKIPASAITNCPNLRVYSSRIEFTPLEISERFKRRVLVQFWDKDVEKYLEDIREVLDGVDEKTKGNIIAKEVYEYFNE